MSDSPPLADPWTFLGSFSKKEIDGARQLLLNAGLTFEVKEGDKDENPVPSGWSGPFALWILDDHAARASDLLIPYFRDMR